MFASIILLGGRFYHVVLYFLNAIFVSESLFSFYISAYLPPSPSYCPPPRSPSLFYSFVISFTPVIKRDCISSSSSVAYAILHIKRDFGLKCHINHHQRAHTIRLILMCGGSQSLSAPKFTIRFKYL